MMVYCVMKEVDYEGVEDLIDCYLDEELAKNRLDKLREKAKNYEMYYIDDREIVTE